MSGAVVFKGTRVPFEALFENLAAGMALDEFLDDFRQWSASKQKLYYLLLQKN